MCGSLSPSSPYQPPSNGMCLCHISSVSTPPAPHHPPPPKLPALPPANSVQKSLQKHISQSDKVTKSPTRPLSVVVWRGCSGGRKGRTIEIQPPCRSHSPALPKSRLSSPQRSGPVISGAAGSDADTPTWRPSASRGWRGG